MRYSICHVGDGSVCSIELMRLLLHLLAAKEEVRAALAAPVDATLTTDDALLQRLASLAVRFFHFQFYFVCKRHFRIVDFLYCLILDITECNYFLRGNTTRILHNSTNKLQTFIFLLQILVKLIFLQLNVLCRGRGPLVGSTSGLARRPPPLAMPGFASCFGPRPCTHAPP